MRAFDLSLGPILSAPILAAILSCTDAPAGRIRRKTPEFQLLERGRTRPRPILESDSFAPATAVGAGGVEPVATVVDARPAALVDGHAIGGATYDRR